jgi:hypothetical protein
MIYNGFRRIALAHSLLPTLPAVPDGARAEDRDEGVSGPALHAPADPADTPSETGSLESVYP